MDSNMPSTNHMQGNYLNKWTHIAFVYSTSHARLFIDGAFVDERETSPGFRDTFLSDFWLQR